MTFTHFIDPRRGRCLSVSCFLFSILADREGGWLRLGTHGPGVAIHDRKLSPPPFSVRVGAVKERRAGRFAIQRLEPLTRLPVPAVTVDHAQAIGEADRASSRAMDEFEAFADEHGIEILDSMKPAMGLPRGFLSGRGAPPMSSEQADAWEKAVLSAQANGADMVAQGVHPEDARDLAMAGLRLSDTKRKP